MTPDEVINALSKMGVNLTRRSLLNYEYQGLITKPERGGGGPGGRWTNYTKTAVAEAYAASLMIDGRYSVDEEMLKAFGGKLPKLPPSFVKTCRENYKFNESAEVKNLKREILEISKSYKSEKQVLEETEKMSPDELKTEVVELYKTLGNLLIISMENIDKILNKRTPWQYLNDFGRRLYEHLLKEAQNKLKVS